MTEQRQATNVTWINGLSKVRHRNAIKRGSAYKNKKFLDHMWAVRRLEAMDKESKLFTDLEAT